MPGQPPAWLDKLAAPSTVIAVLLLVAPHFPPDICHGDCGDLQTASALAGIAHPPGYGGYALLGHLLTWLPGLSPARWITFACAAAGAAALATCVSLARQLGAPAWLSAALLLALLGHEQVWGNLAVPEVYAPSAALLLWAALCLSRFSADERCADLLLAAAALGFLVANRPPALFALPLLLLAAGSGLWRARHRHTALRRTGAAALAFSLPLLLTVAYVFLRDTPGARYNYIESYRVETQAIPPVSGDYSARVERVAWLLSGAQFRAAMGEPLAGVGSRLRLMVDRLDVDSAWTGLPIAVLGAWGVVVAFRRNSRGALALVGILVGMSAYFCAYRVNDDAADVLPMLLTGAVFVAVGGGELLRVVCGFGARRTARAGHHESEAPTQPGSRAASPPPAGRLGMLAFGLALAWLLRSDVPLPQLRSAADARPVLDRLRLCALPPNAVILTGWQLSAALHYEQHVTCRRSDVRIITTAPGNAPRLIAELADGGAASIYMVDAWEPGAGWELVGEGRWQRAVPAALNARP